MANIIEASFNKFSPDQGGLQWVNLIPALVAAGATNAGQFAFEDTGRNYSLSEFQHAFD